MIKKIYFALEESESWVDSSTLGLFPTMWDFPDPKVKRYAVSVPGLSGDIDLSDALTGDVSFENVDGIISFRVLDASKFDFPAFRQTYHGKTVKFRKDTDPNYYRIGRVEITDDDRQDVLRGFSISVDADPFAYSTTEKSYTVTVPVATDKFLTGSWTDTATFNATTYPSASAWNSSPKNEIEITTSNFADKKGQGKASSASLPTITVSANSYYVLLADETISKPYWLSIRGKKLYVSCNGEHQIGEIFATGAETAANIKFYVLKFNAEEPSTIPGKYADFSYKNIRLLWLGAVSTVPLANAGRKPVVPTIKSTVDATVFSNGEESYVTANVPTKAFNVTIGETSPQIAIYQESGTTAGTATIKFREGHFR